MYEYVCMYIYIYVYTYIMYIPYARHMESQRSQENVWIEQIIQATPPNPSSNPLTTAAHLAKSTITSVRPNWLSKALWSWWLGFSSTAGMMWDGEPPYTTMVKAEQFRENPIISISGSAPQLRNNFLRPQVLTSMGHGPGPGLNSAIGQGLLHQVACVAMLGKAQKVCFQDIRHHFAVLLMPML